MPNDGAGIREASPSSEARGSQGPPKGRIGFRAHWIFGNRDAVFPGGAFGHSREVRRNGDRKAFGGSDPVGQDGSRVRPGTYLGWQADQGVKRVKPWVCLDWLGRNTGRGASSDPRRRVERPRRRGD